MMMNALAPDDGGFGIGSGAAWSVLKTRMRKKAITGLNKRVCMVIL
jgi:hypothetical protein